MSKFLVFLSAFSFIFAEKYEVPCLLVFDTDNHRTYIIVNGHEGDIFDIRHSIFCPCYINDTVNK